MSGTGIVVTTAVLIDGTKNPAYLKYARSERLNAIPKMRMLFLRVFSTYLPTL